MGIKDLLLGKRAGQEKIPPAKYDANLHTLSSKAIVEGRGVFEATHRLYRDNLDKEALLRFAGICEESRRATVMYLDASTDTEVLYWAAWANEYMNQYDQFTKTHDVPEIGSEQIESIVKEVASNYFN